MKSYKVNNWPVIDDDGNTHSKGEVVELSEEKARFYSGRLEEVEPKSELPEDLPHRDKFIEAGYSLSDIKESEDLTEVKGIGPASAEDVHEYLSDDEPEGEDEKSEPEDQSDEDEPQGKEVNDEQSRP